MDDYDVVLDALQKHRDKLWERIDRNMSSGYMALNIMDDIRDIRFYQIEQLDEAIMARKNAIDKSLNGEEHMTTTVTLNAMQNRIKKVSYHLMPGTTTTFCQVDMVNGYTVWGMSACVDPSKYNQALGEKYSYEDAMNKLWPLEGYLLAEKNICEGEEHMTKDNRISIKQYEQAADEKVSLEGIKWLRKWDVCVQCDSEEEAEALRVRLAQPESDPVAWYVYIPSQQCGEYFDSEDDDGLVDWMTNYSDAELTKLYTAPPQRKEWVGLTNDEVKILATQGRTDFSRPMYNEFYSAIEAILKEKNGY